MAVPLERAVRSGTPRGGDRIAPTSFDGNKPLAEINDVDESMRLRSAVETILDQMWTAEPAVVEAYDFEAQTVDVLLKNYPPRDGVDRAPVLHNIPIVGAGGESMRTIHPIKTRADAGGPTVGILLFTSSNSKTSFQSRDSDDPNSIVKHAGWGGGFLPFIPVARDVVPNVFDPNEDGTKPDSLGPKDAGIILNPGAADEMFIIIKPEIGEVKMGFNKVWIGGPNDSVADGDFKAVARDGDSSYFSISASQDKIQIGDGN